jgi:hypothetical protein
MATVEHAVPCVRPQVRVSRFTTPEFIRPEIRSQLAAVRFPSSVVTIWRLLAWLGVAP